ncbi:sugar nucleotide-binding protein [Candidatus Roizmanbacteria bacterium]|nr:sugar nucleotide-binding protein [Candidatus Roizmanbacteria bacterium]
MNNLTIAISGATGLVGSRIIELLSSDYTFIPLLTDQVEIRDRQSVHAFMTQHRFDLFLHLAAYTNVDGAETQKKIAQAVNVVGTKNLFAEVMAKKAKFIYVSTDFVFDGTHPPYSEKSRPHPIGYYGKTKYDGEKAVGKNAMIVRIAYPYRAEFGAKLDFFRSILKKIRDGQTLHMVTDSLITPTFIDDIAFSLGYLIENYRPEIFHLVGATSLSPYEAAKLIAQTWRYDRNIIQPVTYDEYFKAKAKRPRYSQIVSLKNTFHQMQSFADGLKKLYDLSL